METLSQRTKRVIKDAGISARILSSVAKVHYTTVYNLLRSPNGEYELRCRPLVVESITHVLNNVERLIQEQVLPYPQGTRHDAIIENLEKLIHTTEA